MKNLITIILLTLTFTIFTNAQIRKPVTNAPSNRKLSLDANLNLVKIKKSIKAKKSCYIMYLSSTAIIPPKNGRRLKEVVGYFGGKKFIKVERNYLRMNDLLLRSDKRFSQVRGDNYEVLIYPESSNPEKIDKNQVKLTWELPEIGLRTFRLNNVSVQYKRHGILIIGDFEMDGVVFGVSMSITPTSCLI